ncbi:hypothetical protein BA894_19875 [Vibrio natriegens]|nr:hypothetical protein BA894_19875 [Vibrio natriegens]
MLLRQFMSLKLLLSSSILFLLTSCAIIPQDLVMSSPGMHLTKAEATNQLAMDELALQSLIMSMADDYIASVSEVAFLHLRPKTENSHERVLVQSFMRNSLGAATEIAAGRSPDIALLDLLVLSTLQRSTFENYWIPKIWGTERAQDALNQLKKTEDRLWQRSSRLLTPSQQQVLRDLIDVWLEENPDRLVVELTRFDSFTDARWIPQHRHRQEAKGLLEEIDSAVSTVDRALLFGERAMWYSSRLTYIAGEQVELSAYRILASPEIQEMLARYDEAKERFEELQSTLASYPTSLAELENKLVEDIQKERELALNQLFEYIAHEREQIFESVSNSSNKAEQMLPATLELVKASSDLADKTNQASINIDRLLARFDESSTDLEGGPPVNPLELIQASSDLANQLQQLISHLQRDINELERLSTNVLDHIFWRFAILILLVFIGLVILRFIPRRLK